MPILSDYQQFDGRHWETGTVANYFAYRGIRAAHTGKPMSEALLMGISGGVVMGYFSFAYKGHDPLVSLLTRNTFDPLDRLLERLGVVQERLHTSKPEKAVANLIDTLHDGTPAIVWADMCSLPYNAIAPDDAWWAMMPIIVYGYDTETESVQIADRARVPLSISTTELMTARARVKKDKFRILTLDMPDPEKLASAVQKGIWDCINLYTEKPPKGSKNSFGLAAFQHWIKLLTKPKQRMSWAKEFPAGEKLLAGLTTTFHHVAFFGKEGPEGGAERQMYANFLDEASIILKRSQLQEAAEKFRTSAALWSSFGSVLLPDEVPPLRETRELMVRRHRLFLDGGGATLDERIEIRERLTAIKREIAADSPLDEVGAAALRERIAEHVLQLHDAEKEAVDALQIAMV